MLDHRLLARHQFALVAAERLNRLPACVKGRRVVRGALADSADLMPTLIELGGLVTEHVDQLLESFEKDNAAGDLPVFSALLESDASVEHLESHLAATQTRLGPRGERAWLRVHDPRVWLHLPRIFSSTELREVFGPMTAWTVFIGGGWITTQAPRDDGGRPGAGLAGAAQWAALERVGAINRVLATQGWSSRDDLDARTPAVDALLVRGRERHGLQRLADLVAYANLGMTVHPRFDESIVALSAIETYEQECLEDGSEADSSVVDALLAIATDEWVRARRELDAAACLEPTQ